MFNISCNSHPQPVNLLPLLIDLQNSCLQPLPQLAKSMPHLNNSILILGKNVKIVGCVGKLDPFKVVERLE